MPKIKFVEIDTDEVVLSMLSEGDCGIKVNDIISIKDNKFKVYQVIKNIAEHGFDLMTVIVEKITNKEILNG